MNQELVVSIVTPCFNASRFIARAIDSVLMQDYPLIEYIVMDGGSTDGTVDILRQYGDRLQYVSAPDNGPADAINRGFARSRGQIFAWLNADDTYLPGAVNAAVRSFLSNQTAAVVYGEGVWTDEEDRVLGRYPTVTPYHSAMLERECSICQPTAFIRREAYEAMSGLDTSLRFTFDYDLWIRLSREYSFVAAAGCTATSRMHRSNLTLGQRKSVFEENISLLRRHYGYVPVNWVYGYLTLLRDGRDQFYEPLRHSALVYLGSLFFGSYYNFRQPWRYWKDWLSHVRFSSYRGAHSNS